MTTLLFLLVSNDVMKCCHDYHQLFKVSRKNIGKNFQVVYYYPIQTGRERGRRRKTIDHRQLRSICIHLIFDVEMSNNSTYLTHRLDRMPEDIFFQDEKKLFEDELILTD